MARHNLLPSYGTHSSFASQGVVNQKFDEEPKYEAYMKLFEPLCGSVPNRPIITEGAVKVRACVILCMHALFVCVYAWGTPAAF